MLQKRVQKVACSKRIKRIDAPSFVAVLLDCSGTLWKVLVCCMLVSLCLKCSLFCVFYIYFVLL